MACKKHLIRYLDVLQEVKILIFLQVILGFYLGKIRLHIFL